MTRSPGTKLYTSQAVIFLDRLKTEDGRPANVNINNYRMVGVHPVYESYEDFKADWPDEEPLETVLTNWKETT